jgi:hypothetical protein
MNNYPTGIVSILIVETLERPWHRYWYLSYCSRDLHFYSLSQTFTAMRFANLRSHEVLSGTELMTESYSELFETFLLAYNTGREMVVSAWRRDR